MSLYNFIWQGDDIDNYERLKQQAARLNKEIPEFIKEILDQQIRRNSDR
ncbi:hypothetical protein NIES4075_03080 [Tolypothrix sp. NIES-4075]|nr:hypothetical protein [Tolypothrix sp. NIES-4075]GAX39356.1 hypothetical protein NIES4075_03080 [Tolypothrix sp. NIES-4075]